MRPALTEDHLLRLGAALTGLILLVSANLAWSLARGHMAELGTICGASNAPHCPWCFGAAGLVLAGLAALAAAFPIRGGLRKSGLLQIKAANRRP